MSFGIDGQSPWLSMIGATRISHHVEVVAKGESIFLTLPVLCLGNALERKSKSQTANSGIFVVEGEGEETSFGRRVFVAFDGLESVRNNSALGIGVGRGNFRVL